MVITIRGSSITMSTQGNNMTKALITAVVLSMCACNSSVRPDLTVVNNTGHEITVTAWWKSGAVLIDKWTLGPHTDKKFIAYPGLLLDEDVKIEVVSEKRKTEHIVRPVHGGAGGANECSLIIKENSVDVVVP